MIEDKSRGLAVCGGGGGGSSGGGVVDCWLDRVVVQSDIAARVM